MVEHSERIEITDSENIFPDPQPESKSYKIQKYFNCFFALYLLN